MDSWMIGGLNGWVFEFGIINSPISAKPATNFQILIITKRLKYFDKKTNILLRILFIQQYGTSYVFSI